MSQFKINLANKQYPTDGFATITVADTTGFVVSEACYQGVSLAAATGSAKVSAVLSATKLKVKGVKGTFADGTAVKSASVPSGSNQAASGFAWGYERTRDVAGTPTAVVFGAMSEDDRGLTHNVSATGVSEIVVATRQALSKMQNTDSSVGPTLTYRIPDYATYADGDVMTFYITSNEAMTFTGAPRVSIATLGSAETVYATLDHENSNSMRFVFKYIVDSTATTAGQIAAVAYNANGAVFTDVGGTTVVPSFGSPSLTGIILA